MRALLWRYRARVVPLSFLAMYETILFCAGASFEAHMLTIVLVLTSFVSWPDETPASEGLIGYHPFPEPYDLIFALALALLPGVGMLSVALRAVFD